MFEKLSKSYIWLVSYFECIPFSSSDHIYYKLSSTCLTNVGHGRVNFVSWFLQAGSPFMSFLLPQMFLIVTDCLSLCLFCCTVDLISIISIDVGPIFRPRLLVIISIILHCHSYFLCEMLRIYL